MKTISAALALALVAAIAAPAAADITLTFEEFVGNDQEPLATFYQGVTFEAGPGGTDWIGCDTTTGGYSASSWPSGTIMGGDGEYWIYDFASATTTVFGVDGIINFDYEDATYVELGYSSNGNFYMDAYDTNDVLMDSDMRPSNLRYQDGNSSGPGTLRVDWDGTNHISYVVIHDGANLWTVDNLVTDASIEIIPAPGALLLGVLGLGMVGWVRKRLG